MSDSTEAPVGYRIHCSECRRVCAISLRPDADVQLYCKTCKEWRAGKVNLTPVLISNFFTRIDEARRKNKETWRAAS